MGGLPLSEQVDLLIVGGGINGAGIARDAAGRGLSVLLVEQDDLASHTSRWSSKLIHGGLRYLEHYEFRLVREALIEREVLLRAAPHIVRPLTFVLPHSPEQRPAWMIRLGLFLYDHLGGRKLLPASTSVALAGQGAYGEPLQPWVKRGFTYADCWVEDSRLVVLNAIAAAEHGAVICTRSRCERARRDQGGWLAEIEGEEGGRTPVRARALVNAAGPWVSAFLSDGLGVTSAKRVRLIKGSHIVVPRLYAGEHPYILQNDDKRIVFVIPFEGAFSLIGTTDVPYDGDPAGASITPDETDYLCRVVNRYFRRQIGPADVVWSYAGVRPLYDDASGDASAVTRDYVFDLDAGEDRAPLLSIFGGKITTYRKLAEHALAKLQPVMGFTPRCVDRGRRPARRRHPGRGLRRLPRHGTARASVAARPAAPPLGARLRHAAREDRRRRRPPAGSRPGSGGRPPRGGGRLSRGQRMGAHCRRHPLAPLAPGPARRRGHGGPTDRPAGDRPHPGACGGGRQMSLRLDTVRRVVGDEVWIDDLTLDLAAGQLYVLLGPTLAGKTSLMRLMAGLDRPTSGRVLVDGADVTGISVRKRSVAMVYQQFINYPTLTAYDNIASPLRLQGTPTAEIDRQVRETARMLHIDHLLDRLPAALSGGQQQRLAIARALVKKAQLLLLDEPLVNLDYKLREELRAELRDLFARQQTTVVYATTEPLEALIMGGQVIVLDEGRILQSGPTVAVYHRPGSLRVASVYSDPPMNTLAVTVADGIARSRSGSDDSTLAPSGRARRRNAYAGRAREPSLDPPAPGGRRHRRGQGGAGRDLRLRDLHPRPQRRSALGGAGGGRARVCAGAAGAGPSRPGAALCLRPRGRARAGARPARGPGLRRPAVARIDFEAIAHSYAAQPTRAADYALKPLQFAFEDGGAYALLGPSGCGKTTLLNIISGLLVPSEGRVLFDRRDVTRLLPAQRNIAQVFQFPVIYDTMTVGENLAFPLRNRGVPEASIRVRIAEVAAMLDLEPLMKRRAAGLTADQKQKISLGRGLVREDVAAILFDEPLTVIDPHLKWLLRRKLKEVHTKFHHTLVYVTHDQNEALTFAEKVVVMYEGEVVQLGTPQELFERPVHRFVGYFIGSPGMNFLGCRLDGGGVRIDGTDIVLGEHWARAAGEFPGAKLELGIRPEFVGVTHRGDANSLPVKVARVEDLGNYKLVTARLGPHTLKAKLAESAEVPGEDAQLTFTPARTLLYADDRLIG